LKELETEPEFHRVNFYDRAEKAGWNLLIKIKKEEVSKSISKKEKDKILKELE